MPHADQLRLLSLHWPPDSSCRLVIYCYCSMHSSCCPRRLWCVSSCLSARFPSEAAPPAPRCSSRSWWGMDLLCICIGRCSWSLSFLLMNHRQSSVSCRILLHEPAIAICQNPWLSWNTGKSSRGFPQIVYAPSPELIDHHFLASFLTSCSSCSKHHSHFWTSNWLTRHPHQDFPKPIGFLSHPPLSFCIDYQV